MTLFSLTSWSMFGYCPASFRRQASVRCIFRPGEGDERPSLVIGRVPYVSPMESKCLEAHFEGLCFVELIGL